MNNSQLQFLSIYWLWLLLPFVIYLVWWFSSKRSNNSSAYSSITDAESSSNNHFYHPLAKLLVEDIANKAEENNQNEKQQKEQKFWQKISFWWQGIAISALIIALAEPVLIGERLPDPPPERDIIFLVDTSVSMQLKDYSLNGKPIKRIELLRKLVDNFTVEMAGEHISVIIFAEQPYILVPLSDDQYLIRRMLSRISTTLAGRYTALGDALLMALKEANKQAGRHQTFIVFSDADESRGKVTTTAAASLVAESEIPVFTIAIGSSQKSENKAVQGGLYQAVNLPLLKEIADITGGKSYQVNNSQAIKEALESILSQRQNLAELKPQYQRETLYFYPLMLGLFMLILLQALRLFRAGNPNA